MAAYDRDQFSTRSKEWLLDYIEQQIDHLGRFETRFRGIAMSWCASSQTPSACGSIKGVQGGTL